MRKFIATIAVIALTLGGCATTNPNGGVPDISAQISQVQKIAAQVCGFVPTVETVTSLVAVFVPGAGPVTGIAGQIANAICAAVAPKAMLAGTRAVVRGVPINGQYVQNRRTASQSGVAVINGVIINGYFVR